MSYKNYETHVVRNPTTAEHGKFAELVNDTRFPAISVNRIDNSRSPSLPALTSVEIYPKYSVLTKNVDGADLTHPSYVTWADNTGIVDTFGRLRVSNPYSLFDSKSLHDLSLLTFSHASAGNVSIYFDTGDASIILSSNSINDYAIRQTFQRFAYQPGKSQLAFFTGVMPPETNVIKRYGLFSSLTAAPYTPNNGLYFEASDGYMSVQINNLNGGTSITPSQSAKQTDWNIDTLDGNGKSGITLDFTKAQIFFLDFEWLSVGRVRFGFVIDGKLYYCHEFKNANNVSSPYIATPNLPVRAEIRQTGLGSGIFRVICQSVISEGGHEMAGVTHGVYTGNTGIDLSSGTRRAILGLRLQHDKLDSVSEIINAFVSVNPQSTSSVANYRWELVLNPTIGGTAPVWSNEPNSSLQKFIASDNTNTVTGGNVLLAGVGNVGAPIDISKTGFQRFRKLGCSINGIRDEIYLVVTPFQTIASNGVWGTMSYVDSD